MASQTERGGQAASQTVDDIKSRAADAVKSVRDAVDDKREPVADTLQNAADTVGEKSKSMPDAAKGPARAAKESLDDAAEYVRENDAERMGRDAMQTVTAHPVASLLLLGAAVIGGGLLLAAMSDKGGSDAGSTESDSTLGLASAVSSLGPKGAETLNRIRDAAVSFALSRAVDTVDEIFPGFREHYERG
jgi:hypothetical protein